MVFLCVRLHLCLHVCMWRLEDNLSAIPGFAIYLFEAGSFIGLQLTDGDTLAHQGDPGSSRL